MTGLARRAGQRPATSGDMPHVQVDQQPESERLRAELDGFIGGELPLGVHMAPSRISVPGARALVLDDTTPTGPPEAFLIGREFAHLHPAPDGSLHLTLPPEDAREAIQAGWAEPHPAAGLGSAPATAVMVYAPRTRAEFEVVRDLVARSHRFASTPVPTIGHRR